MRAPSFSLVTRQYRQTAAVERLAFALELQLAGAELALLVDQERVDRPELVGPEAGGRGAGAARRSGPRGSPWAGRAGAGRRSAACRSAAAGLRARSGRTLRAFPAASA